MVENKLVFSKKTNIYDVIELLDQNGLGILPIVNNENILIGIITDGDLRRGILYNKKVEDIINYEPITIDASTSENEIIYLLKKINMRHVPIIDENKKLIDIFSLEERQQHLKSNYIFILAGGLGSRLGELTKDTPKPMLNVHEKPILQTQIEMFREQGFVNFIISINYKGDIIKNYFGNGKALGIHIEYVEEDIRLGTAGPISLAKKMLDKPFIVINGDILCTLNFSEVLYNHISKTSDATMCIKEQTQQIKYGVIKLNKDNSIRNIDEKPITTYYINSGIYVFSPTIIKFIPKNKYFDMNSLFDILIDNINIKTNTFKISDYWIDIGHKKDYDLANQQYTIKLDNK